MSAGLWIHVVGVADGTRRNIYRDGILKYSDVYAGKIIPIHGAAPMRLGTRDLKSFFMGEMREVRVWNRALTATEVQALHDSGIVLSDALVAEYSAHAGYRGGYGRRTPWLHRRRDLGGAGQLGGASRWRAHF